VFVRGMDFASFSTIFLGLGFRVMVRVKLRNYSDNDILFNIFNPPTQRSETYCF